MPAAKRIQSGEPGIQVSVGGAWVDVTVVGSGYNCFGEGYWFWTDEYRPKFFVQDEGVTWRRRP